MFLFAKIGKNNDTTAIFIKKEGTSSEVPSYNHAPYDYFIK